MIIGISSSISITYSIILKFHHKSKLNNMTLLVTTEGVFEFNEFRTQFYESEYKGEILHVILIRGKQITIEII